jgi:hypothetical protein
LLLAVALAAVLPPPPPPPPRRDRYEDSLEKMVWSEFSSSPSS